MSLGRHGGSKLGYLGPYWLDFAKSQQQGDLDGLPMWWFDECTMRGGGKTSPGGGLLIVQGSSSFPLQFPCIIPFGWFVKLFVSSLLRTPKNNPFDFSFNVTLKFSFKFVFDFW